MPEIVQNSQIRSTSSRSQKQCPRAFGNISRVPQRLGIADRSDRRNLYGLSVRLYGLRHVVRNDEFIRARMDMETRIGREYELRKRYAAAEGSEFYYREAPGCGAARDGYGDR